MSILVYIKINSIVKQFSPIFIDIQSNFKVPKNFSFTNTRL